MCISLSRQKNWEINKTWPPDEFKGEIQIKILFRDFILRDNYKQCLCLMCKDVNWCLSNPLSVPQDLYEPPSL